MGSGCWYCSSTGRANTRSGQTKRLGRMPSRPDAGLALSSGALDGQEGPTLIEGMYPKPWPRFLIQKPYGKYILYVGVILTLRSVFHGLGLGGLLRSCFRVGSSAGFGSGFG